MRRLGNKRNVEKERRKLIRYQDASLLGVVTPITIGYYMVAYILTRGNLNLYISAILAGMTGGLWSFAISKNYDVRRKTKTIEPWYSVQEYNRRMIYCSKVVLIAFFLLIGEIVIIWYFNLL